MEVCSILWRTLYIISIGSKSDYVDAGLLACVDLLGVVLQF